MPKLIATHLLTELSQTDTTGYTSSSVTPPAGKTLVLVVGSRVSAGTPNLPTIAAFGLTWTMYKDQISGGSDSDKVRVSVWWARGNPTAGTIGLTFGQTQINAGWSLSWIDNCHPTVPFVNFVTNNGTGASSLNLTMPTYASPNNGVFIALYKTSTNQVSPTDGSAEVGQQRPGEATVYSGFADHNITNLTDSFLGSGGDTVSDMGLEVNYSAPPTGAPMFFSGGAVGV